MFTPEEGNVIISYCIICFAKAKKYSEKYFGDWRLNILKK